MLFKIGDKVKRIKGENDGFKTGDIGQIVALDGQSCIEILKNDGGHAYGNDSEYLELVKPKSFKAPTHLVIWDEENKDPHKFFTDEKKAKDFMKELSEKSNVVKDSVILVAIKSAQKVSITKLVRLKNYKI